MFAYSRARPKESTQDEKEMRVLVMTPLYPRPQERASHAFVHARNKVYTRLGHEVKVFVPSCEVQHYCFEGIDVVKGDLSYLLSLLESYFPHVIAVHSLYGYYLDKILRPHPYVFWEHGCCLPFTFYKVTPFWEPRHRFVYVIEDLLKLVRIRRLVKKAKAVVYVSQWMRNIAERFLAYHHPNSYVIQPS